MGDGLAIGLIEEMFFRGIAFYDSERSSAMRIVILSSLCFSVVHLTGLTTGVSPRFVGTLVIGALPVGIIFGTIRLATGSIAWPVVLHGLIDASAYFAHGRAKMGILNSYTLLFESVAAIVLLLAHPVFARATTKTEAASLPAS